MFFVFDIQIFQSGYKGLSLEASSGSRGDGGVAYRPLSANSNNVAPQWSSQMPGFISGLSYTTHMEASAEIDTVQNLCSKNIYLTPGT